MSLRRDPHVPGFNYRYILDVSHIPGADNVIADDLSRWDFFYSGMADHALRLGPYMRRSSLK